MIKNLMIWPNFIWQNVKDAKIIKKYYALNVFGLKNLKRRKMLERDIQLHILKYLQGIGAYAGKTKTMGVRRGRVFCYDPYCFRGFADITGFHNKKLFFIEVKKHPNKQSLEQLQFQKLCNEAGITYILAYDVQDVVKIIY